MGAVRWEGVVDVVRYTLGSRTAWEDRVGVEEARKIEVGTDGGDSWAVSALGSRPLPPCVGLAEVGQGGGEAQF